jgi:hypothetical protein
VEATPSVVATTSLNTTAINKWKKWVHFELEYFDQKKSIAGKKPKSCKRLALKLAVEV